MTFCPISLAHNSSVQCTLYAFKLNYFVIKYIKINIMIICGFITTNYVVEKKFINLNYVVSV